MPKANMSAPAMGLPVHDPHSLRRPHRHGGVTVLAGVAEPGAVCAAQHGKYRIRILPGSTAVALQLAVRADATFGYPAVDLLFRDRTVRATFGCPHAPLLSGDLGSGRARSRRRNARNEIDEVAHRTASFFARVFVADAKSASASWTVSFNGHKLTRSSLHGQFRDAGESIRTAWAAQRHLLPAPLVDG